jgi:hypothetical protein
VSARGALNVNLLTHRMLTPYVSIGAGIVSTYGVLPHATIAGTYRFPAPNIDPRQGIDAVVQTDTVTIRYEDEAAPLFTLGGGFKLDLTPRSGIRGDVRFDISPNNGRMTVDAAPSETSGTGVSFAYLGPTSSMVFSSSEMHQGSLSGPPITAFETFRASGTEVQTSVTLGYFVRF